MIDLNLGTFSSDIVRCPDHDNFYRFNKIEDLGIDLGNKTVNDKGYIKIIDWSVFIKYKRCETSFQKIISRQEDCSFDDNSFEIESSMIQTLNPSVVFLHNQAYLSSIEDLSNDSK